MALAYFITFTTYGTWLPGSEKESVDRWHNDFGTPHVAPDADREQRASDAMTQPVYLMGPAEREIVCQAIVELAAERAWELHAAHVRSNHVHIVISAERDPGRLMSDIKARASRNLTSAGFGDAERRRWSRHGSTRHLFKPDEIEAKIKYTLDEQGPRMAWYSKYEPRTK